MSAHDRRPRDHVRGAQVLVVDTDREGNVLFHLADRVVVLDGEARVLMIEALGRKLAEQYGVDFLAKADTAARDLVADAKGKGEAS